LCGSDEAAVSSSRATIVFYLTVQYEMIKTSAIERNWLPGQMKHQQRRRWRVTEFQMETRIKVVVRRDEPKSN